MGALARFIRFFTGDDDERKDPPDPDPDKEKKSNIVGKGQVDYMILKT